MQANKKQPFTLHNFTESGILAVLVLLCIIIWAVNPVFMGVGNILNVLRTTSYVLIIATASTMLMITGGLDLSVGSQMGLGGILVGTFLVNGVPVVISILLALFLNAIIGLANGFFVVKRKIPPMIATIGTMYIARGLCNGMTKGMPVYPLPSGFAPLGNGTLGGIPYVVFIAIIIAIIANYFLRNTTFGRSIYAIGGNQDVARLSGIAVDKIKMSVYVMTSLAATFTGIIMTSRIESAQVTLGTGYEMSVIASIVIGGTSTMGGSGSILGTVIGAMLMSVVENGMVLMRVSVYWQNVVVGSIIIVAVMLDMLRKERAGIRI